MEPPSPFIYQISISTRRFSDSATTEVRWRTAADKNAVVFNVSDRMTSEMVKSHVPNACGVADHKCSCIRSKKKSYCYHWPDFSDFHMRLRLNRLSTTVKFLSNAPRLLKIKYLPTKFPCEGGFLEGRIRVLWCPCTHKSRIFTSLVLNPMSCKTFLPKTPAATAMDMNLPNSLYLTQSPNEKPRP